MAEQISFSTATDIKTRRSRLGLIAAKNLTFFIKARNHFLKYIFDSQANNPSANLSEKIPFEIKFIKNTLTHEKY